MASKRTAPHLTNEKQRPQQPTPKKRNKVTNTNDTLQKIHDGIYTLQRKNSAKFRSSVWEHVKDIMCDGAIVGVKCNFCDAIYSSGSSSSSWSDHLGKMHKKIIEKKKKKHKQTTLRLEQKEREVKFTRKDKQTMKDAQIKFVVLDLRSFNATAGDGFDYCMTAAYNLGVEKAIKCKSLKENGALNVPSTVSRGVEEEYDEEIQTVKRDFKAILRVFPPPLHITTDCSEFKSKKTGDKIVGVTCHWVKRNDPNIQLTYLKCDSFRDCLLEIAHADSKECDDPDDHTSEEESIEDWDAIAISSDEDEDDGKASEQADEVEEEEIDFGGNYANLRKVILHTFQEFGLDEVFVNYAELNIVDLDQSRTDHFKPGIATDNHSANVKAFGKDENDNCSWFFMLILCFNHNWNLVIKWMIQIVKQKHKPLRRLIRLIKKLIRRVKKSNLMNDYDPSLKQMCETRWEGIYESLNSIVANQNYSTLNGHCTRFNRSDLIMRISLMNIKQLVVFFERIVFIHKHFQAMHKARIHHVIYYTHYILTKLSIPLQSEYSLIKKLKREMHKQTKIRIVPKISYHHWYGLVLNPMTRSKSNFNWLHGVKYTHLYTKEQITIDSQQIYDDIIQEIKLDLVFIQCMDEYLENRWQWSQNDSALEEDETEEDQDDDIVQMTQGPKNNIESMLDEINSMAFTRVEEEEEQQLPNELDIYLAMQFTQEQLKEYNDNPMILWNTDDMYFKLPKLSRLACFNLSKPPVSSPSECLFSLGNNIVDYKRTLLKTKKVSMLTFLVSRWKYNK
eukprot:264538_1